MQISWALYRPARAAGFPLSRMDTKNPGQTLHARAHPVTQPRFLFFSPDRPVYMYIHRQKAHVAAAAAAAGERIYTHVVDYCHSRERGPSSSERVTVASDALKTIDTITRARRCCCRYYIRIGTLMLTACAAVPAGRSMMIRAREEPCARE